LSPSQQTRRHTRQSRQWTVIRLEPRGSRSNSRDPRMLANPTKILCRPDQRQSVTVICLLLELAHSHLSTSTGPSSSSLRVYNAQICPPNVAIWNLILQIWDERAIPPKHGGGNWRLIYCSKSLNQLWTQDCTDMDTGVSCYVLPGKLKMPYMATDNWHVYLNLDVIFWFMSSSIYMYFWVTLTMYHYVACEKDAKLHCIMFCVTWLDIS